MRTVAGTRGQAPACDPRAIDVNMKVYNQAGGQLLRRKGMHLVLAGMPLLIPLTPR
jgi:hypothetical protein